jgi:4'-phosphopantetheinyl transferase
MIQPVTVWSPPPPHLVLRDSEVHIWCVYLNQPDVTGLRRILSADEVERAEKFKFLRDRDHFIAARGVLRTLLGNYLELDPAEIRFSYSAYGKPELAGSPGISFNISHSHELALFAFTARAAIGIDIEYLRRDFIFEDIAEKFFSRDEVAALREIPEDRKAEAFFDCWTCKEAYIKAVGEGLSHPLDSFSVSFESDKPDVTLKVDNDREGSSPWNIVKLTPAPGYAAAIAMEGEKPLPTYWQVDL